MLSGFLFPSPSDILFYLSTEHFMDSLWDTHECPWNFSFPLLNDALSFGLILWVIFRLQELLFAFRFTADLEVVKVFEHRQPLLVFYFASKCGASASPPCQLGCSFSCFNSSKKSLVKLEPESGFLSYFHSLPQGNWTFFVSAEGHLCLIRSLVPFVFSSLFLKLFYLFFLLILRPESPRDPWTLSPGVALPSLCGFPENSQFLSSLQPPFRSVFLASIST